MKCPDSISDSKSAGRQYIAIDLKSFYASVECVERGLDPLDECLVVADASRTDKTICLAVSPALKAYGTGGRPRLFEVVQRVREVNRTRGRMGKSTSGATLATHPELAVDYRVAPPRMGLYLDYSARIFDIYLRFIAPDDIHVYSVDEVFIDATDYLSIYNMDAHHLAMTMIRTVLRETGITATAGIGTNMYLCKIAMDIVAKKMKPDADGVRIASLDEASYRRKLWTHRPLTDFWRVGRGTAIKLGRYGIETMGDIAKCSLQHEDLLYHLFGINAELLIDHAWGWEPVTMDLIKSYRPETHSISTGQVLTEPYSVMNARNVALEMIDAVSLELVEKRLVTDRIVLTIGYDVESLTRPEIRSSYSGALHRDHYGRLVPGHSHGTHNLAEPTSSTRILIDAVETLFDRIVTNKLLLVRRITIALEHIETEQMAREQHRRKIVQPDLFCDFEAEAAIKKENEEQAERERKAQQVAIRIKKMFGKNAILKGLNYAEGATQRTRNKQIGGHHE